MIHRQNWLDIRVYLHHMKYVRQNDPGTVLRARTHLYHLLEWADEIQLTKARGIDPAFPAYLLNARRDGKENKLAPASITKCLAFARQFLDFARDEWPLRYKPITPSWIEMLQPPRHMRLDSRLPMRQFYTLDQALQIASVSTATLREQRGQAAVCMLFLSGMRADALASLPISCVNIAARQIMQLPEAGVRTKGRKAAITYLLEIPELLKVIETWNDCVRAMLSQDALWYSPLTQDGMDLRETKIAFQGRHTAVRSDTHLICELAGVEYLSPHKLRHGHVVYALKQARNMAEMKAISQNVMHASVTITDQVYGNLIADDVKNIIGKLGKGGRDSDNLDHKITELIALLQR